MHHLFKGLQLAVLMCLALSKAAQAVEKRLALVIGVHDYQHFKKLENTVADAELIASKLQRDDFDVKLVKDPTRQELLKAILDFARKVEDVGENAVALLYYAGHGVQDAKLVNYLIGADSNIEAQTDLPIEALKLDDVLQTLTQARPRLAIAILDACRDDPLPASRSRGEKRGLAPEAEPARDLLILYSTEPGKAADDGPARGHSPFAAALAEKLDVPGLEASQLIKQVSLKVLNATHSAQFPWTTGQSTRNFYFRGGPATGDGQQSNPEPKPVPPVDPTAVGEIAYGEAVSLNTIQAYESWLQSFPGHPRKTNVFVLLQRLREQELWGGAESAITLQDKESALRRLVEAYPDGVYAEKARQTLAALQRQTPPAPPLERGSSHQEKPAQTYYYVTGLDPNGYNWLALRSAPSFRAPWSNTHLTPGTPLTLLDRSGEWAHVRLQSGEEGYASTRHLACCSGPEGGPPQPSWSETRPAQQSGARYYRVTGLDPKGYNWLALRNAPSFSSTWSNTHLTPGMPLSVIGRSGEWAHVRLQSGEEGWANSKYLACCVNGN